MREPEKGKEELSADIKDTGGGGHSCQGFGFVLLGDSEVCDNF